MKEYRVINEWEKQNYLSEWATEKGWTVDQVIPVKKEIVEFQYVIVKELSEDKI